MCRIIFAILSLSVVSIVHAAPLAIAPGVPVVFNVARGSSEEVSFEIVVLNQVTGFPVQALSRTDILTYSAQVAYVDQFRTISYDPRLRVTNVRALGNDKFPGRFRVTVRPTNAEGWTFPEDSPFSQFSFGIMISINSEDFGTSFIVTSLEAAQ